MSLKSCSLCFVPGGPEKEGKEGVKKKGVKFYGRNPIFIKCHLWAICSKVTPLCFFNFVKIAFEKKM